MAHPAEDIAEHVDLVFGDGPEFAVVEYLAQSDDAVQRGAQFVGNAGEKAALGHGGGACGLQRAPQLLVLVAQLQGVLLHLAGGYGGQVALGDIQQGADRSGDFTAIVADQVLADFDGKVSAVVDHIFALEGAGFLAGLDLTYHGLTRLLLALRRHEIPREAARHLLRRTFQEGADRLVEAAHHALQAGLFVGYGRAVEKVAVTALADPQFEFPFAQEIGGIFQLTAERGDFIQTRRQRFQRQAVRQAARIFLYGLQAPHHAAGQQKVDEQGAQRADDAANDYRAEQADARLIARIAGLGEPAFLVFAEQRHAGLKIAHHGSIAIPQRLRRTLPRT